MSVPSPDALLHLATLHLLSQAGFASTSQAASLTLSSVVGEYFKLVARASVDRALLAGRSKPGVYDVVGSLEELGYGSRLEDLYEYRLGSERDTLEGEGLGKLADYLNDGLVFEDPIAELRLVHEDDLEEGGLEDEKPEVDAEDEEAKDEPMEVDSHTEDSQADPIRKLSTDASPPTKLRFPSPDFSWLPPIPDSSVIHRPDPASPSAATQSRAAVESVSVPSAIVDRYRTRIPFSASSLTAQSTYNAPSSPPTKRLPIGTSSLPDLISTYSDTKGETSVAIRPNGYRFQALDLLRRQIAAPETYSPSDTLSVKGAVPGPRFTPIAVPPHPVAINPDQSGLLSRLLHSIQSVNLPSELRERLTTLRPPLAQKRDGQPLTYGPAIRGADDAALFKAQGKESTEQDQVYAYATWDSGPRGLEKFSRPNLPRGKKVIKYVEGEDIPRQEKRKASEAPNGTGSGLVPGPARTLKLKIGESLSPAPGGSPMPSPGLGASIAEEGLTPPLATPGGTTLKLRIKRESADVQTPTMPISSGQSESNPMDALPGSTLFSTSNADDGNANEKGLPEQSLRDHHVEASRDTSFTNPSAVDTGLPHGSARLSASPINPTHSLPNVEPSGSNQHQ